ncbi:MAG: hypothetical protein L0027_17385 [Candidatus Rokubacteria bacterium]|nr:hypothetical protein [Candidatus Rokubacteria bacterium]
MATKSSFTPEEWDQLRRAPVQAGLVVVAASPSGPIGVIQEMFALGKLIAEAKGEAGANELVKTLVADLTEGGRPPEPTEARGMSPDKIEAWALDGLRSVGALVAKKAPGAEADGFKRWLVTISQRVAEAAKEGGFLGFGGTQVSESESAALKKTAEALGVPV